VADRSTHFNYLLECSDLNKCNAASRPTCCSDKLLQIKEESEDKWVFLSINMLSYFLSNISSLNLQSYFEFNSKISSELERSKKAHV
jgi:hypothetical protein